MLRGTHQNSAALKLYVYNVIFCENHGLLSFIKTPETVPASKANVAMMVCCILHLSESDTCLAWLHKIFVQPGQLCTTQAAFHKEPRDKENLIT